MFKRHRAQMRLEKVKEVEGEFPLNKAGRLDQNAGAVCARACACLCAADRPDTRWQEGGVGETQWWS